MTLCRWREMVAVTGQFPHFYHMSLGARSRPNWETHQWTKEWTDPRIAEETYHDPSRIKVNNHNTRVVNQFCAFIPNEFKKAGPESTGENVSLVMTCYSTYFSDTYYWINFGASSKMEVAYLLIHLNYKSSYTRDNLYKLLETLYG